MNSILESFGKPDHDRWMGAALAEAQAAAEKDEVPIGCVIVHNGVVIGRGHNLTETLQDPTAHAEMIAITAAAEALGSRRLLDCALYVTLEPCAMCAGAIVLSRIPYVVYGAADPKAGATDSLYNLLSDPRLNHRSHLVRNVRGAECSELLSAFFAKKREDKKLGHPDY
ncbi:tRNA adenosine(34) deaminase TadA [bacterium]|nr:tRNA adenosine(34) deaminase TadA [bacterium]